MRVCAKWFIGDVVMSGRDREIIRRYRALGGCLTALLFGILKMSGREGPKEAWPHHTTYSFRYTHTNTHVHMIIYIYIYFYTHVNMRDFRRVLGHIIDKSALVNTSNTMSGIPTRRISRRRDKYHFFFLDPSNIYPTIYTIIFRTYIYILYTIYTYI